MKKSSVLYLFLVAGFLAACTQPNLFLEVTSVSFPTQIPEIGVLTNPTSVPEHATDAIPSSTPTQTSVAATTNTPVDSGPILQLVFVSNRVCEDCLYGFTSDLYKIDIGCLDADQPCLGEAQLLFQWDKTISAVDWSPDGSRLVFESEGDIYLADWNGANAMSLSINPGRESVPRWSPDGTRIAYIFNGQRPESEALEASKIQIFDLDAQHVVDILPEVYDPTRVDWLPNGGLTYIAKVSETDWTEQIIVVDLIEKITYELPYNVTEYTHLLGFDFSPDASHVVFVGNIWPKTGLSTTDIYVAGIEDHDETNLTDGVGFNLDPTWSPLGGWIAFESDREGDYDIYLVNIDGSKLIQITPDSLRENNPSWRILP